MAKEGDKMVTSKRQLEYAKKYLGKFDEIKIRVPEGEKDKIKEYAVNLGQSMNSFIISAINEAMTKKPATTENEIPAIDEEMVKSFAKNLKKNIKESQD